MTQRDKGRTIDQLYIDSQVTSATVGTKTNEELLGLLAFNDFKAANSARNLNVPDITDLTANSVTYGIDFSNFAGKWYTVSQLTNVIKNAVSIYNTFVVMKNPAIATQVG